MTDKFIEMILGTDTVPITEKNRVEMLSFSRGDAQTIKNTKTVDGVDGEITYLNTYAPFEITFKLLFLSEDVHDKNLFEDELIEKIHTYDSYYIRHSYHPNKKYAVNEATYSVTEENPGALEFELKFTVFKGYSESLHGSLSSRNFEDENFDFGMNILSGEQPKYTHTSKTFKIYNASSMTVTPIMRHKLDITLTCAGSPKITNNTTGDVFEYIDTLKKTDTLKLSGVYAYKDDTVCGRKTNHGIITLAKGWNEFTVSGASDIDIEFDFSFIYR